MREEVAIIASPDHCSRPADVVPTISSRDGQNFSPLPSVDRSDVEPSERSTKSKRAKHSRHEKVRESSSVKSSF